MVTDTVAQTLVALITLAGSFTAILISLATGRPIPDGIMTLITLATGTVLGWYFGTRATATGAQVSHSAAVHTAATAYAAGAAAGPPPSPAAAAIPSPPVS